MYSDQWAKHFRHAEFRPGQKEALEGIAKALDNGTKFVICELPTGLGKSDIAVALAQSAENAYISTSQNILIDQYMRDFGHLPEFYHIKGKKNYACHDPKYKTCHEGDKMGCSHWQNHTKGSRSCNYKTERDVAMTRPIVLTNTKYYALGVRNNWESRSLTVIDEAHNLASDVLDLVSFEIGDRKLDRLRLSTAMPKFPKEVPPKQLISFVTTLKLELADLIEMAKDGESLVADLEDLEDLYQRCDWFLRSVDEDIEWVVDFDEKEKKVIARPLSAAYFASSLFFKQSDKYLLQSATIVNHKKYADELGINTGMFIRKKSPFPAENRPLYPMSVGKLSKDSIDETLPKIAEVARKILLAHKGDKGIIHTNSYKIQKYLQDHLKNPRLLFPAPGDRMTAIMDHMESDKPTVLVSPSMTEGLDLKGDLARFSIVVKIPYPNLGDRRIKILCDRDWNWYSYQTAKTFLQAIGRGVRSETDWCRTYVLDSDFDRFVKRSGIEGYLQGTVKSQEEGLKLV